MTETGRTSQRAALSMVMLRRLRSARVACCSLAPPNGDTQALRFNVRAVTEPMARAIPSLRNLLLTRMKTRDFFFVSVCWPGFEQA